jgi:hypothetical protein
MPNTVENWRGVAVESGVGVDALPEPKNIERVVAPKGRRYAAVLNRTEYYALHYGNVTRPLVRVVPTCRTYRG